MSRAKRNAAPFQPGSKTSLYFGKNLPFSLFNVLNQNLSNANGFILEILSAVVEDKEIYIKVSEYVGQQPTGYVYRFPDIHLSNPKVEAEAFKISEVGESDPEENIEEIDRSEEVGIANEIKTDENDELNIAEKNEDQPKPIGWKKH